MADAALTVLAIALAYVLGSVPTGLWLGLAVKGVDIRQRGSGNIGATNTLRVLGKKWGAVALAGDAGKGFLSVVLVSQVSAWPYAPLACGLAAIFGHTASVFCDFKGGKGVATSAGVFLALSPVLLVIGLAAFAIMVAATHMVSAGSVSAAVIIAVAAWLVPHRIATLPGNLVPAGFNVLPLVVTALTVVVIVKHRANLHRILRGEENKLF